MLFIDLVSKSVLSFLKQSTSLSQLHIDSAHFYAKSRNQEKDFPYTHDKKSKIVRLYSSHEELSNS